MSLVCETPAPEVDERTRGVATTGGYLALWRDDGTLAVHKVRPDDEEVAVIETCGRWKLEGIAGLRWSSPACLVAWNARGEVWCAREAPEDGSWLLTPDTAYPTGVVVAAPAGGLIRRAEEGALEWWERSDSSAVLVGQVPPPVATSWTTCVPMSDATAMAVSSSGALFRVDFTRGEARPVFTNLRWGHLRLLGSSEDAFHMHGMARDDDTSLMLVAGSDAAALRAVAVTHDRVELYAPDGRMLARWIAPRGTGDRGEFAALAATRSRVVAVLGSEVWSLHLLEAVNRGAVDVRVGRR